jgi:hypothetical protein
MTVKIDGVALTLPPPIANTLTGSIIHGQEMRLFATNSGDFFRNSMWSVKYEIAGVVRMQLHCEEGDGNSCFDVAGGHHGRINSSNLAAFHDDTQRTDSSYNTVGGTISDGVSYYDGIVANNRLANPSFETGRIGWNFTEVGSNQAVVSTEQAKSGLQSIKLVIVDGNNPGRAFQAVSVVAGNVLKMSGWHYGDGVNVLHYEIHNNTVYGDLTPNPDHIAGGGSKQIPGSHAAEWRYFEVSVTVPAGCTSVNCYYYSPNVHNSHCYWDQCAITINEPAPVPIPAGAAIPRDDRNPTKDVLGNTLVFTGVQ